MGVFVRQNSPRRNDFFAFSPDHLLGTSERYLLDSKRGFPAMIAERSKMIIFDHFASKVNFKSPVRFSTTPLASLQGLNKLLLLHVNIIFAEIGLDFNTSKKMATSHHQASIILYRTTVCPLKLSHPVLKSKNQIPKSNTNIIDNQ